MGWWDKGELYTASWLENLRERPLRRHRCRCVNNIKEDLQPVGWRGFVWVCLA
jgi:hypothetical protein